MIVFKTFLKVLNKCKIPILLYTGMLLAFSISNMKTSDNSIGFVAEQPKVIIINNDSDNKITNNLVDYITDHSDVIDDVKNMDDALFYRDINYIIYIPKNYSKDFLEQKNPPIEIKSTGDYQASLEEIMLDRYLKVANVYASKYDDEDLIIEKINKTMDKETKVEVKSGLDTNAINLTSFYYTFLTYSILAGTIYTICLVLAVFKEEPISKRISISSMNYKRHNRLLLISNVVFCLLLWLLYVIVSFIICKKIMFTKLGIIYIFNSLLFSIMSTALALLLSSLIKNKDAINGIVNVIALGSSFLCGVFVPTNMLPEAIINISKVLPTYWYVKTIENIIYVEEFTLKALKPSLLNMGVLVLFTILFIIINNIVSKKNQKYN